MTVNLIYVPTDADWLLMRNFALTSKRKHSDKTPSSELRLKYLLAEETPIRELKFVFEFIDIKSWIATHLVRHGLGTNHCIASQRNDMQNEYDRDEAPQKSPVIHVMSANAQALINISKARLCINAHIETRKVWKELKAALAPVAPEMVKVMVPPCIYRDGICPKPFSHCGYNLTPAFKPEVAEYRAMFEQYYK